MQEIILFPQREDIQKQSMVKDHFIDQINNKTQLQIISRVLRIINHYKKVAIASNYIKIQQADKMFKILKFGLRQCSNRST